MEIQAVLEALRAHPGQDVEIVSDSKYVVDCLTQRWFVRWKRNGWRTSQKSPVVNKDLWEAVIEAMEGREVKMVWVRGHAGNRMNEFVDQLARTAVR
jgi:ribonuclease HI